MATNASFIPQDDNNIRVAVVGNVDSGKSTLVGVLTKGIPDDGRGSARLRVFNYLHEAKNGRTSSIAQEIMGFDQTGHQILPERFVANKNKYWAEVMASAQKVINFIDLCGHEKYLKTTLHGLMGIPPDYVLVVVGANMGVSKMTKEHIGIAASLDIPVAVAVTKVDMVLPETLQRTVEEIRDIFHKSKLRRKLLPIEYDEEDICFSERESAKACIEGESAIGKRLLEKKELTPRERASVDSAAELIYLDRASPLFLISAVTGFGLLNLKSFFFRLRAKASKVKQLGDASAPVEFDIHEHLNPHGVGLVASGLLRSGTVRPNMQLLLGPDAANQFKQVLVRTVHFNRVPVSEALAGQFCCFALKSAKKAKELELRDFRKGCVLLDPKLNPCGCYGFEAHISVLHHATTIHPGYECVMHMGVIRQTIKFLEMEKEVLRTGDRSRVTVKFLFSPEYLKENATFMLREGRTKVVGQVLRLIMSPAELPAWHRPEERPPET